MAYGLWRLVFCEPFAFVPLSLLPLGPWPLGLFAFGPLAFGLSGLWPLRLWPLAFGFSLAFLRPLDFGLVQTADQGPTNRDTRNMFCNVLLMKGSVLGHWPLAFSIWPSVFVWPSFGLWPVAFGVPSAFGLRPSVGLCPSACGTQKSPCF